MATTSDTPDSADANIFFVKPEQVEAMRDAAYEGRHGARDDAVITLLYDTGLRRSELVALDCGMLDLEAGHLAVPSAIQKDYPNDNTPSDVRMQLDPEDDLRTVRTLRAYLGGREDGALFASQKADRLTPKGVNDIVSRLAERADVRPHHFTGRGEAADVTPHTFRHSVAYRFLHEYDGYTLYNVSQRLRHSRLATTEENYAHFDTV